MNEQPYRAPRAGAEAADETGSPRPDNNGWTRVVWLAGALLAIPVATAIVGLLSGLSAAAWEAHMHPRAGRAPLGENWLVSSWAIAIAPPLLTITLLVTAWGLLAIHAARDWFAGHGSDE